MQHSWVKQWKREHLVPWECEVCSSINRYSKTTCNICGKAAPKSANLKLNDAAAEKIQSLYRRCQAKKHIRTLCSKVYAKSFDPHTRRPYYVNTLTGVSTWQRPRLFQDGFDVAMDDESKKEQEKVEKLLEEENERRIAKAQTEAEREEKSRRLQEEEDEKAKNEIEVKWDAPFLFAERTGELNANWKGFMELPSKLMKMGHKYTVLRLIGNPLRTLPYDFSVSFTKLTVLSLSNCGLQSLPENFGELKTLTDLNLMKNELENLPESFGMLVDMVQVHLSSNKLSSLPSSFENLIKVPRLNLERNSMRALPEAITKLQLYSLSLSKLGLFKLPKSVGNLSNLVSLTANENKLRNIPRSIGLLEKLEHLSLCNNMISFIPDEICNCKSLRRLWLDWNCIAELPGDFLKLTKLENIHLEGNPMRIPETEVIVQGVQHIREWYIIMTEFTKNRERKWIVEEIQGILFQCIKRKKVVKVGLLEYPCKSQLVGEESDKFFAFPHFALFEEIIPRWNEFVDEHYLKQQQEEKRSELMSNGGESKFSNGDSVAGSVQRVFTRSAKRDDESLSSSKQGSTKSKPCLSHSSDINVAAKLTDDASTSCSLKSGRNDQSSAGTPIPSFSRFLYTQDEVMDALENYKDAYGVVSSIEKEKVLFKECNCRSEENGERKVCIPPNKEFRCERVATLLKAKLVSEETKSHRESIKAEEQAVIKERLKARNKSFEYAESEEGKAFFESRALEEADKEMENVRMRRFEQKERARKMKKKRKSDNKREKRRKKYEKQKAEHIKRLEDKRKEVSALKERSAGWEYDKCLEQLVDIEDELDNLPEDEELERLNTEQEEADELFEQQLETTMKIYKKRGALQVDLEQRFSKEFKNYLKEFREALIEAHAVAAEEKAEEAVHREYRISRKILKNWTFLNLQKTFRQWKDYVLQKMYWRARLQREGELLREMTEMGYVADKYYKNLEQAKWIQKVDVFSDKEYWQHKETKEISWTQPTAESFIPRKTYQQLSFSQKKK